MSERTFYRHKAKGEIRCETARGRGCETPRKKKVRKRRETRSATPRAKVAEGVKPAILNTGLQTHCHTKRQKAQPNGYQGIATALSRINDAEQGMV